MAEGNLVPESIPLVDTKSQLKDSGTINATPVSPKESPNPNISPQTSSQPEASIDPNEKDRLQIRDYLNSGANRIGNIAQEIAPWLTNDSNRRIFVEEWTRAVQSAKNLKQLYSISNLAFDPHQQPGLVSKLRSLITAAKPELVKGKSIFSINVMSNNPEYDGIRRAVGEKLKTWGLTNSGIKDKSFLGEHTMGFSELTTIFHLLHPNPDEEYTYTATETKIEGKIFKKSVKVPVEKHGKKLRPYEQLMAELLQNNQPQSTPAVPKV